MNLIFGMIFLSLLVIGSLGNCTLLHHYAFLYFRGCRLRSTDVILRQLTIANLLLILCRGILEVMSDFGLKHFLNDAGCKLAFYVHRVARGVSLSTTCLLSVFQAITISPWNSRWAELKGKVLKHIGPFNIFCWVLHMFLNIRIPMLMTAQRKKENMTKAMDFQYCSTRSHDKDPGLVFAALIFSHDILCLELMIWASGSMVFILYKHKQRVHHIQRHNISSRSSPETRASQSILALVSAFVSFYTLSSVAQILFSLYGNVTWWLIKTSALINTCFPTVSPFILINRERSVSWLTSKK
ncbi:PREDICTED: vomeronasal type-1 receptor 2-like [Chinchilla lanigera]|uniref:vomeronasal type-1 receptor 2-like n=1 Tax=Chinchilla lanigera TaxID=34839 RepID=UPI000695A9D0|nr:PREDICTED: vomeronasal type-1 receptor 2-like [Chinchilla lanigera]